MRLTLVLVAALFFCSISPVGHFRAEALDEDINSLTMHYYSNPQPDKIPGALKNYLLSEFFNSSQPTEFYASFSYLVGRIAKAESSLIPEYLKIFDSATHNGRVFLIMVFQICGNEQVKEYLRTKLDDKNFAKEKGDIENILTRGIPISYNPLKREVKDGVDLDALWAEFFVTGEKEPIVKIVDVLTREDRFKNKLRSWMSEKHTKREIRNLNTLVSGTMIKVDLENGQLDSDGDMDCLYSASLSNPGIEMQRSKTGIQIRKILGLSQDDLVYMATKGAAMWSLKANAEQHPKVLEYCKQEFARRNDKSKIELAIILEVVSPGSIELVPTGEGDMATMKLRKENN
ncbi:MAG TPA: hypothetical protein PL155_09220 [Candidatus Omnitrophota bacterium]|nr:hypothetical protein [Candidatus Omnitrophota bacterium]HPD85645.1 hypothetical protein [Candidatus Omnitrophota bacterium]HRZ04488.1 hypothetical protein [Candidatus Omnitrophota bacterium]